VLLASARSRHFDSTTDWRVVSLSALPLNPPPSRCNR
jgi:hypothetical protein